ncbi:MAG: hypothetical protein ACREU9_00790 [Gammaproteobacteria bacterium]
MAVAPTAAFTGICTTLSTAYSLIYILGDSTRVTEATATEEREGKKFWKRDFLDRIKSDQGHSETGTPRDKIKKAYERYGCRCGDEVRLASVGTAAAWKKQLADQLAIPANGHFIIDYPGADGTPAAHDMHIDGINDDGVLGVADTGIQGGGTGDDVPVVAGQLEWDVTDSPTGPQVKAKGGGYWGSRNVTAASFICCTCPQ